MMHAKGVAYAANGNRHIYDMEMHIWEYDLDPDFPDTDPHYIKLLKAQTVYGAIPTKILARTNRKGIATDITLNG
jgi:hypothetical protein